MKTSLTIEFTYDEGLVKDCKRNGVIKRNTTTVNRENIMAIAPWKGSGVHVGRFGTKVIMSNGKEFVDDMEYEEFLKYMGDKTNVPARAWILCADQDSESLGKVLPYKSLKDAEKALMSIEFLSTVEEVRFITESWSVLSDYCKDYARNVNDYQYV